MVFLRAHIRTHLDEEMPILPFVITHNVSGSIDSELIKKLIKNVESNRLKKYSTLNSLLHINNLVEKKILSHALFTSIPRVFKTTGNFKRSSKLFQLCCQNYMRTGKYVFDSDSMHLYTLRDKFSCNAVNVVYQITCAGCKQGYIGESQDFHQRMNLLKADVRTLNTDCLADLHINWCLSIKYEHLTIPYFYCMSIYYSSSVRKLRVKDQDYFHRILKSEL